VKLNLFPFRLPLNQPLVTAHGSFEQRDGLLVGLSEGQHTGWGEVCPLPGWSVDDLGVCERRLRSLVARLNDTTEPEMATLLTELEAVPAARAGLAGAWMDLAARTAGQPLAAYLSAQARDQVRVSGMISEADPAVALTRARTLVESGIDVLKVKVAARPLTQEVAVIQALREEFGSRVALRLDANGGWSINDAVHALAQFAEFEPVYCEEPTAGIDAIAEVGRRSPVPVAVDESARTVADITRALVSRSVAAVVIKPQAIGGPDQALVAAEAVQAAGVTPIITSMIDSAIGVAHAVHVAAAVGGTEAHGVATSDRVAVDVAPALPVRDGSIRIPAEPGLGLSPFERDG